MSDCESDTENRPLSSTEASSASPSNHSNSNKDEYQAQQIERLFKMSMNPKQYIIKKIHHH
jgi:hypothetical protein